MLTHDTRPADRARYPLKMAAVHSFCDFETYAGQKKMGKSYDAKIWQECSQTSTLTLRILWPTCRFKEPFVRKRQIADGLADGLLVIEFRNIF